MNADLRGRIAEPSDSVGEEPSSAVDDPRVAAGLDEYLAELQAGRRPSREEFVSRHPEIADALDRGLDVLEFLHSNAGSTASQDSGPPTADSLPPETTLGDYRLIREVGRGGMGVVYEAHQISLGRRVAVKVLSGAGVLDPRRLQRFRIEAQAVAQLNHAHIVPIFAVGFDRGIHYYAMQYVEGCTLAEILENHPARRREGYDVSTVVPSSQVPESSGECGGGSKRQESSPSSDESSFRLTQPAVSANITPMVSRDAFRAIARLAIQAADGLDHAHTMGILHRDIKPSNLLVDSRGSLWITDFGLARFQDDSGLTLTGDLVGTLRYMGPELAMGRRMSFDPRSDIYALGATLYELLTLRPVFSGSDRRELLRQIAQDEPIAPRRRDPSIPRDLETIVTKAMDKEPERRYPSARELADDLGRFLADQPIRARPPSPWERIAKSARRHRAVLMATASMGLVALGIASGLLWQVWQEQQRTAMAKEDIGESLRLWTLADDLTMSGMGKWAMSAMATRSPEDQQGVKAFYIQALAFYERLTREPSHSPRMQALAFRRLGFTRMVSSNDMRAADDFRHSIEIYDRLLATEPGDAELREGLADAHYNLGMLLKTHFGEWNKSELEFRKAIEILEQQATETPHPDVVEMASRRRLQFAAYLAERQMVEAAARERRAVFEFFERLTDPVLTSEQAMRQSAVWASSLYMSLSQALAQHGLIREEEDALRRGLKFEPKRPDLLFNLARLLAFRKGADRAAMHEAVELAKTAAETVPGNPDYWRVLAWSHLHEGDWLSAAAAVDKSLKLQKDGGQASDRLIMAMVSFRQKRLGESRDLYIRAMEQLAAQPNSNPELNKVWAEAKEVLKPVLVAEKIAGSPDH